MGGDTSLQQVTTKTSAGMSSYNPQWLKLLSCLISSVGIWLLPPGGPGLWLRTPLAGGEEPSLWRWIWAPVPAPLSVTSCVIQDGQLNLNCK